MPLKTSESADQSIVTMQNNHNIQQKMNGGGEYSQQVGSTEIETVKLNKKIGPTPKPPVQEASTGAATTSETADTQPTKEERRAALRAKEEARVMKAEAEKTLAEARKLSSSKEALLKGDLDSLAKSYGMTRAEYIDHVNRSAMGLPDKPLTAEEQKVKAEKEYQERQVKIDQELFEMRKRSDIKEYVSDHITPVLLENKDNYKLLLHNEDRKNVELFVYQYIDQVWQETGKAPNAKDVMDSMEEELWQELEAKATFARETERGKKFFNLEDHLTQSNSTQQEEEDTTPPPPAFKKTLVNNVPPKAKTNLTADRPWNSLSRAEKMAEINKKSGR